MSSRRLSNFATRALTAAAMVPVLMGSLCGEDLVLDPSFELWCGASLCEWSLEEGEVERTATWHEADYGAALVGAKVALSQLIPGRYDCLAFDFLTFHEEGVELSVALDFHADGTVDLEQKVDGTDWNQSRFRVRAPEMYRDLRLGVVKRGEGRAVLARVKLTTSSTCAGERVAVRDRPVGGLCGGDLECSTGWCRGAAGHTVSSSLAPLACGECGRTEDCAEGICFLDDLSRPFVALRCGPPPAKEMGRSCLGDAECESGICCGGQCSECCDDRPCPRGACAERSPPLEGGGFGPSQCQPGEREGEPGAPCLDGTDCQSGTCAGDGLLGRCFGDGFVCSTDADCDGRGVSVCLRVGEKGGRCR